MQYQRSYFLRILVKYGPILRVDLTQCFLYPRVVPVFQQQLRSVSFLSFLDVHHRLSRKICLIISNWFRNVSLIFHPFVAKLQSWGNTALKWAEMDPICFRCGLCRSDKRFENPSWRFRQPTILIGILFVELFLI